MPNVHIDLSKISGVDPNIKHLKGAGVDFSPYRAYPDAETWVTREILRVKCPAGVADTNVPPTPVGNAYEVQERGFRGARHGYVLVPDVAQVNYIDLVWVDRATLDPETPLDPAWVSALAEAVAAIETAQDAADAAQAGVDHVAAKVPTKVQTWGDRFVPYSKTPVQNPRFSATFLTTPPTWFYTTNQFIRWDTPGTFTFNRPPVPYATRASAALQTDLRNAAFGSEILSITSPKNQDVTWQVLGKQYAIRYFVYGQGDAQIFYNGAPLADVPIASSDPGGSGAFNWIVINNPEVTLAELRFCGEMQFSGIDFDTTSPVYVRPSQRPFCAGLGGDSYSEPNTTEAGSMSRSAAVEVANLTGARVYPLGQGGTGLLNNGTGKPGDVGYNAAGYGYDGLPNVTPPIPPMRSSVLGSASRIAEIAAAPIDLLLNVGTINDSNWTVAEHRAALIDWLDKVNAVRPDLPIALIGMEPVVQYGNSAIVPGDAVDLKRLALEQNLVDMVGTRNVVGVVQTYNQTPRLFTGTGNVAHPAGDGMQDLIISSDGSHLQGAGLTWFWRWVIAQLAAMPCEFRGVSTS